VVSSSWLFGEDLPEWYTVLRDAVYSQNLSSREIAPIFNTAKGQAVKELSGVNLSVMLSRCEYMMGRSFQLEEKNTEARACFEKGLAYAQESLDMKASPEGWQMLSENISYLCTVRSNAWVMANGLKVERYAKSALELDPGNTAAQFLVAARWVYAPSPFHNYKRGLQMMEAINNDYSSRLHRDDRFNVYLAIGYAHNQQKRSGDARIWFLKALDVYPDNKYVKKLIAEL